MFRESNPDPKRSPTFKLIDFFIRKYDNGKLKAERDCITILD